MNSINFKSESLNLYLFIVCCKYNKYNLIRIQIKKNFNLILSDEYIYMKIKREKNFFLLIIKKKRLEYMFDYKINSIYMYTVIIIQHHVDFFVELYNNP